MNLIYASLNWIFGVFALLMGIAAFADTVIGGIALVTIAFFLLPPAREFVDSHMKFEISGVQRSLIIFLLLALFIYGVISSGPQNLAENAATVTQEATKHSPDKQQSRENQAARRSVVCDKFQVKAEIVDKTLQLSLSTDLPDDTVVSVTVGRSYWEKGSAEEYARPYHDETSTVDDWRKTRQINISAEAWRRNLSDFQIEMERATLGFEVAKISNRIDINIVVPVNGQTNPVFGDRNVNLTGSAVIKKSYGNLVREDISLEYPL